MSEDGTFPTAEQIASQLEQFLAEQRDVDDFGFDGPDADADEETGEQT